MPWIAAIVGLMLGGSMGEGWGALSGAVIGWLLVRSAQQARRITALEQAVAQPVSQSPLPVALPALDEHTLEPFEPEVADAPPAPTPPRATLTPEAIDPVVVPPPEPAAPPVVPPAPVAVPAFLLALQRWVFGGNTIVKLGVGILFIGLAFLAKYASEQVRVPVELRLAGIGAVALLLLGLGWRLRERRPAYAHALQGGAVAVLYLTLFVAFRFYGVLAAGPVFVLLASVAALAAALAVLQDAPALALIGALGGFAAPLLVATGQGDAAGLFSYYLVLDLGIAAVAWFKTWRRLNLVGFVCTFGVATAWGVLRYEPAQYTLAQTFLVLYFLLFNAILLLPARRANAPAGERPDAWVNGSLLFGLPTVAFALQLALVRDTDHGAAFSALALAAFYVALARLQRGRAHGATVFEGALAVAIVFLSLVIPLALDARRTGGAWALEAAGLVWLGVRQQRRLPRVFGYALLLLAGAALLLGHDQLGAPTQWLGAALLNGLMLVAGAWFAAWRLHQAAQAEATVDEPGLTPSPRRLMEGEASLNPLLVAWGAFWWLVTLGTHVAALVPPSHTLAALLTGMGALAATCSLLATRLHWPTVGRVALLHAPAMAVGVLAVLGDTGQPLADGGLWAWPLAAAVHALVLRQVAPTAPARAAHLVHVLGVLVLATLLALQGRVVTQGWGEVGSAWGWLGWLLGPALVLLALLQPGTAGRWPVREAPQAYRGTAAGLLAAGALLWALLANAVSDGSAQPLAYLPLLNPLDLGVGLALFGALRWHLLAQADEGPGGLRRDRLLALLGLSVFVWLNAMVVRAFHHFGGVPFAWSAWTHSLAVHTGISLLWTVTALALMSWAARGARRQPWMAGAALLAAVVLKLLLVDLSGSGTVTRIVSFIGVGGLMLVIGYVAPLPARRAEPSEQQEGPTHAPA